MNPEGLRAGKAIEQTGNSPHPPEASDQANPASAKIPPILFEGDEPERQVQTIPTPKFALGGPAKPELPEEPKAKLPEAYGTETLLLTARDPHSLFAHWDLTKEQLQRYNALSAEGHLNLRAYAHAHSKQPAAEVAVGAESRHRFLHVERSATSYVGELGYYQPDRSWKTIATSAPATTPPDSPSEESGVIFSAPHLRKPAKSSENEKRAPAESVQPAIIPVSAPRWPFAPDAPNEDAPIAGSGIDLDQPTPEQAPPFVKRGARKTWTSRQEQRLAEMIRLSLERREWLSSAEIVKLVQENVELSSETSWPLLPGALASISSPTRDEQVTPKGFWFNVNAELIIYGATEPAAQVTIAGQSIQLRPDGTFRCQFALPDGDYALAAIAVSPENERREAVMDFSRHTNYSGDVGTHPQNPSLERLPQPE